MRKNRIEENVTSMARKNVIRAIKNHFGNPWMQEPMNPGSYEVAFKLNDEQQVMSFNVMPGDVYESFAQICEGYCIGAGDDRGLIKKITYKKPDDAVADAMANICRYGLVIKVDDPVTSAERNIFLTPNKIKEIVKCAGRTAYNRTIPFSASMDCLLVK